MLRRRPATTPSDRARLLVAVLPLLGAACGGFTAAGSPDDASEDDPAQIAAVEVVEARRGAIPLTERLTGTARASGEVGIYPEVAGPVIEVLVNNGDAVRRGDPLVRIRAAASEAQLAQARSGVAAARADVAQAQARLKELEQQFLRIQTLADRGLVSASESDAQRAQVETARAELTRTEAQVALADATVTERSDAYDQAVVRAPISGRVGQRNVEVGMRVDTQTALFTIGRLDTVRVEVPVSQEMLTHIREGQRVEIRPGNADADAIPAQISRISPFLRQSSLSADVEIDVPNDDGRLIPGMFVTVDFSHGESDESTLVPMSALYNHPVTGERGVFVSSATPAAVMASQADDEGGGLSATLVDIPFRAVEVVAEGAHTAGVEGVAPGEWVVVVGQHLLSAQDSSATPQARIRAIDWDRIVGLQGLEREDLLRQFMEKQRRLAGGS